uniref:Uncharacterized protein n=1 Tax=Picea sitchensis TaxID=3332 RepID=A9NME4_PICSI|nr:unknown [Picea sitchensis]
MADFDYEICLTWVCGGGYDFKSCSSSTNVTPANCTRCSHTELGVIYRHFGQEDRANSHIYGILRDFSPRCVFRNMNAKILSE